MNSGLLLLIVCFVVFVIIGTVFYLKEKSKIGESGTLSKIKNAPMKRLKWVFISLSILIAAVIGVYSFNYFTVIQPMNKGLSEDSRNEGFVVNAHYENFIYLDVLNVNLKDLPSSYSKADVFRVLLQTADALKDKTFSKAILSRNGDSKFYLDGNYFHLIGDEYEWQNVLYTQKIFPSYLYNMDGNKAYKEHTGSGYYGLVDLTSQINDLSDFVSKWTNN